MNNAGGLITHNTEVFTSLVLTGGRECIPGKPRSWQSPDLWIKGGAIIDKTLCVGGNISVDTLLAANVITDTLLVSTIEEKYLHEGIDIYGDTTFHGNVYGIPEGSGTVTSVGLTAPTSVFNSPATNSPITTSGTLDLTFTTQSANTVFAGPAAGASSVPTFRNLVVADLPVGIPNSNLQNSSITVTGTGITVGGSPVALGGTLTLTNTGVTSIAGGSGISVNASTGAVTVTNTGVTGLIGGSGISVSSSTGVVTITATGGGGTVTSVGLTAPTSVFNSPASGSPVTTSGTLGLTFINQSANTVFAGPTTGAATVPAFRALVVADLPTGIPNANLQNSTITVTGTGITVGGSPVALGGTVTLTNAGVTSITGSTGVSASSSTGAVTLTNTGVTSLTGGTGVSVSASTGAVTVTNTGVTGLIGGSGISVSASTGVVTITATGGGGTVTSVGLTAPTSVFNSPATNSPITTSGTLGLTFINQSANTVFAGPTTGAATVPAFRALVVADLPTGIPNANLQNSSITVTGSGITVGGSPVSLGGTLTLTNAGVTSITGSTGISANSSTGAVTLTNTGVTSITGTANQVSASASTGAVTLSTPSTFIAPGTIQDTTGMLYSTNAAVSAAGATQGTATALTKSYNVVTTVAASTGVALPTPTTGGLRVVVVNKGANTLNIYPAVGGQIDALGTNVATTLAVGSTMTFQASSTTQWYQLTQSGTLAGDVTGPFGSNTVVSVDLLPIHATTGSNSSIFFGYTSTLPTAIQTVGMGYQALNVVTGQHNTAYGYQAATGLTSGTDNTSIGYTAGPTTSSSSTVMIGDLAGRNAGGNSNVCVGSGSGISMTGSNNVTIGYWSGGAQQSAATSSQYVISGNYNIGIGAYALGWSDVPSNSNVTLSGSHNVAIGDESMSFITGNAADNVGLGGSTLIQGGRTQRSVAIGSSSLTAQTTVFLDNTMTVSGTSVTSSGTPFLPQMVGAYLCLSGTSSGSITAQISRYNTSSSVTLASSGGTSTGQPASVFYDVGHSTAVGYNALRFAQKGENAAFGYLAMNAVTNPTYTVGTVGTGGIASTTITGTGTSWFSAMVGGVFQQGAQNVIITGVSDPATITVDVAVTITNGSSYTIYMPKGGNLAVGTNVAASLVHGSYNTLFGTEANVGANTTQAMSIGYQASATADLAIAIGYNASVAATDGIAIGDTTLIQSGATGGVALGLAASILTNASTAICIGSNTVAHSTDTIFIGHNAKEFTSGNDGSIGIGHGAQLTSTGQKCILIGDTSRMYDNSTESIAMGSSALISTAGATSCINNIAIGKSATVNPGISGTIVSAIVIGDGAQTITPGSSRGIAIGKSAAVTVADSIALGTSASTGTVAGGSAGLAITVPTDTHVGSAPGAATDSLVIMINGTRYKIALTAFP